MTGRSKKNRNKKQKKKQNNQNNQFVQKSKEKEIIQTTQLHDENVSKAFDNQIPPNIAEGMDNHLESNNDTNSNPDHENSSSVDPKIRDNEISKQDNEGPNEALTEDSSLSREIVITNDNPSEKKEDAFPENEIVESNTSDLIDTSTFEDKQLESNRSKEALERKQVGSQDEEVGNVEQKVASSNDIDESNVNEVSNDNNETKVVENEIRSSDEKFESSNMQEMENVTMNSRLNSIYIESEVSPFDKQSEAAQTNSKNVESSNYQEKNIQQQWENQTINELQFASLNEMASLKTDSITSVVNTNSQTDLNKTENSFGNLSESTSFPNNSITSNNIEICKETRTDTSTHFQENVKPVLEQVLKEWLNHSEAARKLVLGLETKDLHFQNGSYIHQENKSVSANFGSYTFSPLTSPSDDIDPESEINLERAKALGFEILNIDWEACSIDLILKDEEIRKRALDLKNERRREFHINNTKKCNAIFVDKLIKLMQENREALNVNTQMLSAFVKQYGKNLDTVSILKSILHGMRQQVNSQHCLRWRVNGANFLTEELYVNAVMTLLHAIGLCFDENSSILNFETQELNLDHDAVFYFHPEIRTNDITKMITILKDYARDSAVRSAGSWEIDPGLLRLNYEPQGWFASLKNFFTRLFGL